jgi:exopolysaccharide biosynthesis polyprenyl glycosylphosphotransferase
VAAASSTLLLDSLCIVTNALVVFYIRAIFDPIQLQFRIAWPELDMEPVFLECLRFQVLYFLLLGLWFKNEGLHAATWSKTWPEEARVVLKAVSLATLTLMVILYLAKTPISRFMVLASWGLNVATMIAWRGISRRVMVRRVARGDAATHVLIVGADGVGRRVASALGKNGEGGVVVKGFLDDYQQGEDILGRFDDLDQIVQRHFIDEVIVTVPSEQIMKQVALKAGKRRVAVKVVPPLVDEVGFMGRQMLDLMGDVPVLRLHHEPVSEVCLCIKRCIDVLGAVVGLFLFGPVMCAVAVAIKVDDGGPFLYRSQRVGRKGRLFTCYKFRTMVPNADHLKELVRHLNERQGPLFKITNDPRLTRLGPFLRKYSLDELLQFFNVLKGDMSLVGPRPPTPDEVAQYEHYTLEYYRRLHVRPGMTSLWALQARNDPAFDRAFSLDCAYIENWNLWSDLKILFWTIRSAFLKGEGR